jgi:dTDP-4-amino-4,6-dideoxygalactose transaminase
MRRGNKDIFVARPTLPPLEKFIPLLEEIWDSRVLTNEGPFHKRLEQSLCDFLEVKHLSVVASGTLALVIAMRALGLKGSVITTPFSFVATTHSLIWDGLEPIFVDIDPSTFNMDASKLAEAIRSDTTGLLPVHCYGLPCDVDGIQAIADKYKLKVIYDGAHCFGVHDAGGSILRHGDLSTISFHATKTFTTFEGGAIVTDDPQLTAHVNNLKNFGIMDEISVVTPGINAKMSEIHAAFGLLQLQNINAALEQRRLIDEKYRQLLAEVDGIRCVPLSNRYTSNCTYFPILVEKEYKLGRDQLYELLRQKNVYARRYFYPLISNLPMYRHYPSADKNNLPIANDLALKILCLPIYADLTFQQVRYVCDIIRNRGSSKIVRRVESGGYASAAGPSQF